MYLTTVNTGSQRDPVIGMGDPILASLRVCVAGFSPSAAVCALSIAELGHTAIYYENESSAFDVLGDAGLQASPSIKRDLFRKHLHAKLTPTTDLAQAVSDSDVLYIVFPPEDRANGNGQYPAQLETMLRTVAKSLAHFTVIVETSTVPLLTSDWIINGLLSFGADREKFEVVSCPMSLHGNGDEAVQQFLSRKQITAATSSERSAEIIHRLYAPLTSGAYYSRPDALTGELSCVGVASLRIADCSGPFRLFTLTHLWDPED